MGSFFDPGSEQELVYFANAATHKVVRFYSLDGHLVKEVSLRAALDSMDEIGHVDAWHLDSIVLSEMYTNRVAFVDGSGACWRMLELDSLLNPASGDRYELWPSNSSTFISNGALWFTSKWVGNTNDQTSGTEPQSGTATYNAYYSARSATTPVLVRLQPSMYPTQATFLLDSFYHRLSDTVSVYVDSAPYVLCNDRVFLVSHYSPRLIMIDAATATVLDTLVIHSEHPTHHIPPPPLINSEFTDPSDPIATRLRVSAFPMTIMYDRTSHQYAVVLKHAVPVSEPEPTVHLHPFSILRYDTLLNFVSEQTYPGHRYMVTKRLSLKDGLYMYKWEGPQAEAQGKVVFEHLAADAE